MEEKYNQRILLNWIKLTHKKMKARVINVLEEVYAVGRHVK
jgi:hypothetical protein